MKFEWKWVNKLFCTWRKRATQFCIILSSILLLRPASEHQRASWEHPNLGEENLNIPLASDYPWIGLRPAQDSPFPRLAFHIWNIFPYMENNRWKIWNWRLCRGVRHAGNLVRFPQKSEEIKSEIRKSDALWNQKSTSGSETGRLVTSLW